MAATSTQEHLFLAPQRSTLALFQQLVDEGKLTIPNEEGDTSFLVQKERKLVPSCSFFHSKLLNDAVELKNALSIKLEYDGISPAPGEYVGIQFKTLIIIWYMIAYYDTYKHAKTAMKELNMHEIDLSHIDLRAYFNLPGEPLPMRPRDLFSIILNSFFITSTADRSINVLLINAKTSIIAEYERIRECKLLTDEHCVTYQGTGPYIVDLYGTFIKEYVSSFMHHYGNVLSINKGRYV